MNPINPDRMVADDDWSDLTLYREMPDIDTERLHAWRIGRIRGRLREADASMCLLVNPVSLRYAVDYRTYALFQSHIPTAYLFVPVDGPTVMHGAYGSEHNADEARSGRRMAFFDGGPELQENARRLAGDVVDYLAEIGAGNRRVAVEYVNPSLTQAMMQRGLEVIDGVVVSEMARAIKSEDEIACIRWAVAVAEHGLDRMKRALRPGVTETRLWALLNYTNIANDGDWHDGRMLASGPRTNPWCQEASPRRVESGDLVGVDTDMVGPFGYFADVSRTFHCGPARPTRRQKELYRLAVEEIEHNLKLVRPGVPLTAFQHQAHLQPEEFHANAYSCLIHGVGMCDEYPRATPIFRGPVPYEGVIEAGMVICVESYVGAAGERDGVKLEQQVLVTPDGCESLSTFPLEEALLD